MWLLREYGRLAEEEGIDAADLEEMDAINEMRRAAEVATQEQYVCHSGTSTP